MSPYMVAELGRIAALQRDTQLFTALDKLATVSFGGQAPGYNAVGSTNMPGYSVHCDRCFAKLKKETQVCPKCGGKIKKHRDMKGEEEDLKDDSSPYGENSDTGGEAAEKQETSEDETSEMGKYSSKRLKDIFPKGSLLNPTDILDTPMGKAKATAGLGLSGYGGVKLIQLTKDPGEDPRLQKVASKARVGPRGWNFRRNISRKFVASPGLAMSNLKKKTKRSAEGLT